MKSKLLCAALLCLPAAAPAEEIGAVSTNWRALGPNDKVVVEAYDDPLVSGVTCYVSRAKTGGVSGGLGLAEDVAEASIACRQTGEIAFREPLAHQQDVFTQRMSILFKQLHVTRIVDQQRNALIYLVYSDRLVSGSPKNSVTAVPVPRSTTIPVR